MSANIDPAFSFSPGAAVPQEVLDLEHLGRYTMNDRQLESELLALFRSQYRQQLAVLGETTDGGQWRSTLHTLKGAAGGVGAWQLSEAAAALELIPVPDLEERESALDDLAKAGRRCLDAITMILAD